ncbi:NrsF family protein [Pantoea sp. BAV 3049]|uniref:NrsF family protein n=1 Tax=Pantoea sp. BAV 3049 TaxID=2654188 RepID=UPI00131AC842|nr:NrsF family protein [Pantoea sp. BAV 3049]
MTDHDLLIDKLSRGASPVKRTRPTGWRVLAWIAMALPCGAAASLIVHRTLNDWSQPGMQWAALQLLLTFLTGTLAIRNAFQMSIAGRRPLGWRWFMPLVGVWLVSILINLRNAPETAGHMEGTNCYLFMMVVSIPMMAIVIGYLRQTRALFPVRSLAVAGAGVACMALSLLSLCHPIHLHWLDFIQHLGAIATIVLLTILFGRRWVVLR